MRCVRLEHDVLTGDPGLAAAPSPTAREPGQQRLISLLVLQTPDDEADDPEDAVRARTRLSGLMTGYGGELQPSPGSLTYVTFGARNAHEDDPERAVVAAREALATGLAVRAGVGTGPALTAGDGIAAVAGATARRAESACRAGDPGRVALDEATQTRLATTRPTEPGRFVGRERELADLAADLDRVSQRKIPVLVTLLGEPGMGKSRLAAEFLSTLGDDVHTISVRVPAYGVATGRGLIAELVGSDIDEAQGSRYDAFRYGTDQPRGSGRRQAAGVAPRRHAVGRRPAGGLRRGPHQVGRRPATAGPGHRSTRARHAAPRLGQPAVRGTPDETRPAP